MASCALPRAIATTTEHALSAGSGPTTAVYSTARMCSEAITCGNCTAGAKSAACYWNLKTQTCEAGDRTGDLIVSHATECPRTTVEFDGRIYRLSIYNDRTGLMTHLNSVGVNCSRGWLTARPPRAAVVNVHDDGSGEIVCAGYPLAPGSRVRPPSAAGSFYVTFGPDRVMLRTDDRADFYASALYERECGRNGREYCIGYLKKDSEKRFYTQWCPRNGRCVDWMVNVTDPMASNEDHAKVTLVESGDDEPRRDVVAAATLSAVEPAHAMWNADETPVLIDVRGHGVLSNNTKYTVTLAGQDCGLKEPAGGLDSFRCQVCGPMDPAVRRGPVRVDYGPLDAVLLVDGELLAAAQTRAAVEFGRRYMFIGEERAPCNPRPLRAGADRLRGIASGGHLIPVRWTGLECVDPSSIPEMILYNDRRGDGFLTTSVCLFDVGSSMACQAPTAVNGHRTPDVMRHLVAASERAARDRSAAPLATFRCGFKVISRTGDMLMVPCPPGARYTVYPDPVFRGFSVTNNGGTVVIWGDRLVRGFVATDVRVRLASGTPGYCGARLVAADRIECNVQHSLREHVLHELKQIWVDVGIMPVATVNRTNENGGQ